MAEKVFVKKLGGWFYAFLCANCSAKFYAKKSHAQYCGPRCRAVSSRAVRKAKRLKVAYEQALEKARQFQK